jgi:hypothetical protein
MQTSAQTDPLSRHIGGVGGAAGLRRVGMLVGQVPRPPPPLVRFGLGLGLGLGFLTLTLTLTLRNPNPNPNPNPGQVARVHHTVWEKSGRLAEELQGLKQGAG